MEETGQAQLETRSRSKAAAEEKAEGTEQGSEGEWRGTRAQNARAEPDDSSLLYPRARVRELHVEFQSEKRNWGGRFWSLKW